MTRHCLCRLMDQAGEVHRVRQDGTKSSSKVRLTYVLGTTNLGKLIRPRGTRCQGRYLCRWEAERVVGGIYGTLCSGGGNPGNGL